MVQALFHAIPTIIQRRMFLHHFFPQDAEVQGDWEYYSAAHGKEEESGAGMYTHTPHSPRTPESCHVPWSL